MGALPPLQLMRPAQRSMFNGSNLSELGSQLSPALCASLEGTHGLLKVGRRPALMEILVGEIKEGFREELTLRTLRTGFPLPGSD